MRQTEEEHRLTANADSVPPIGIGKNTNPEEPELK